MERGNRVGADKKGDQIQYQIIPMCLRLISVGFLLPGIELASGGGRGMRQKDLRLEEVSRLICCVTQNSDK